MRLGGLHVMSCAAEAAEHADVLALGEGCSIWPRVLSDVEDGEIGARGGCLAGARGRCGVFGEPLDALLRAWHTRCDTHALRTAPEMMGGAVVYRAGFSGAFREDPAPRRELMPKRSFLTVASFNATRGCHNRCGFCYLSTKGLLMPYQTRDVAQVAEEFVKSGEPYGVFTDNNLGSKPAYLRAAL